MSSWQDSFKKFTGKTRFVVSRLFVHLAGSEVTPLLGVLNRAVREIVASEGNLEVAGERLVEVCQSLLQYDTYWQSASNEGDVIWDEGEAGDFFDELFTDSASRYLSSGDNEDYEADDQPLTLSPTGNLVVMLTVAFQGEVPDIEADLASMNAMTVALKALINLHYQEKLRGIQIHFSPARLGDELDNEQLLLNFPELIPL
ncbi:MULTISPECIES: DUF1517 domain-containing protein [Okeania]|uniref:DUF1517 domain-containing protein n=1 Tax=Okeania hirsuta TaxID=1458930 RepID=A0A3N6NZN3_9CYAN|nr:MULTISPECIES: DUF1517 domain-containing protein [Okeania]NES74667.1 DUF1517 domain-containing protein [Okeania sp. SIO1H4]NES91673.1 DUF1517 domain-containing protein [Okeania sp. SIO2B9]NET18769.1 DUF1517 domain-containing protein [Okeania sp. SIO1H5]NET74843.1 DUF1517 domain-containing protein [Okeania sp. SIO1F9]NET97167.1 DUF1517 domain-containing protein [Okeania sp. SIO1H2]